MMPFPLLLAGPILRRVEPTLVTVWAALREPATLELKLWTGLVHDESAATLFNDPTAQEVPGALARTASTIRVGDQLHIAVVTFKLPPDKPLVPHVTYSYNLVITAASGTQDLKSLGLLRTDVVNGRSNLALGYSTGFLPSFALTPMELTDLRIMHGSCRLTSRNVTDGLAWVDDFIESAHSDPKHRPHQLLLTGDQIYADDVPAPLLSMIIDVGKELIGAQDAAGKRVPFEQLPLNNQTFPADEMHFPPGYRLTLTMNEAKLTSVDGDSHLLSLGDFCAMYLLVWSNACWPEKLPTEAELISRAQPSAWLKAMPPDLRTKTVGDPEMKQLIEFFQMGDLGLSELEDAFGPEVKTPSPFNDQEKKKKLKERSERASRQLLLLKQLTASLPKVRRALANVPTYMMMDDHEITDDWYLNPMWRDRVLTNTLGRTMIRNGLVAYGFFQGWGNDPVKFESGDNKNLLDASARLFPANTNGPNQTAGNEVDHLLGLDVPGSDPAPPVKWHFSVKGSRHLLVAIDNRTRRSFVSRVGPPENLSAQALKDQVPEGPLEAGLEVLILVAPLPVIGPPTLDEFVAPLVYRVFDVIDRNDLEKTAGSKGMAGTNPDAIEAWAFAPFAVEALLERLEPFRRVVILSGDVHNGSSQSLSYWKKGDTEPAVFAQFTSSGIKNVMPWYIRFVDRSFATGQRVIRANIGAKRLGWKVRDPNPLTLPPNAEVASSLLSRLRHEPVLIPGEGWPSKTKTNRPPDFQWHAHVIRDERADKDRPEAAHIDPLNPANTDVATDLEGYRQVVVRHAKQLHQMLNSRQILFANNMGLVRFETEGQAPNQVPVAIQELHTTFPFSGAETLEKSSPFTLHRVRLGSAAEKTPEQELNES